MPFYFWLQPFELIFLAAEIEFSLLEYEKIEELAILKFLLEEVGYSIHCFLPLSFLYDIDVAGILKI